MTLPDTLAALSEAATQGLLQDDGIALTAGGADVCLMGEPAQWSGDSPDMCPNDENNTAFLIALWNAYRTGQLVPVPSVETVARAIHEAGSDIPWEVTSQQDIAFNRARAVIAAMKEPRP